MICCYYGSLKPLVVKAHLFSVAIGALSRSGTARPPLRVNAKACDVCSLARTAFEMRTLLRIVTKPGSSHLSRLMSLYQVKYVSNFLNLYMCSQSKLCPYYSGNYGKQTETHPNKYERMEERE
jgi:hypothetical protein